MTLNELGRLMVEVAGFGAAVPVLLGALGLLRRPPVERAAWVWMAGALSANLWLRILHEQGRSNNFLTEFSLGAKALIIIYVLGELVASHRSRRWLYAGLGIFLGVWMWRALEGDHLLPFSKYTLPTYQLLLAIAATVLVLERLRMAAIAPFRDFGMLIGLATVITYAPSAAMSAVGALYWESHPELVMTIYSPRSLFTVIGLIFFSLAFLWTIPSRSSSGSSASAA